jgi:hypothetical protein
MEEIKEQMTIHEEIAGAISSPIGNDLINDTGLESELDALIQEELNSQLAAIPFPSVPVILAPMSMY